MSDISSHIPTNYTSLDEANILSSYSNTDGTIDYDAIVDDILNNNEERANREDLISFYIVHREELPPELLQDPNVAPDALAAALEGLYSDSEVVDTLQNWHAETLLDQSGHLELFDNLVFFLNQANVGTSTVDLSFDLISDHFQENRTLADVEAGESDKVILTDMMAIALQLGSPQLALLFFLIGFKTRTEASEIAGREENQELDIAIEDIEGNQIPVSGADNATVVTEFQGFGGVVQDFQMELVEELETIYDEVNEKANTIATLTDPEQQGELERERVEMRQLEDIGRTLTELTEMAQDLVDMLVQTIEDLQQRRRDIISRINR